MERPHSHTLARFAELLSARAPVEIGGAGRYASVAVVLRESGPEDLEVLLIRRSEVAHDPWSGHMAMPGGKQDSTDPTLEFTAVRETLEEVGIDLRTSARAIGRLDQTPAYARGRPTGLVVAPYVFAMVTPAEILASHEVQEALWVPLRELDGPMNRRPRPYDHEGVVLQLPSWHYEGRIIWGLTYFMLEGLLALARAVEPR